VAGVSPPKFDHMLKHGVESLEKFQQTAIMFKDQYGEPEQIRDQMMENIRILNEMAFEIRAQVNNFNKFSGLANEQLDKMASGMVDKMAAARERINNQTSAMRDASVQMVRQAEAKDAELSAMVDAMQARVVAMSAQVKGAGRMLERQQEMLAVLARMRAKLEETRDMAEMIHMISSNPEFKAQFQKLSGDMRSRVRQMKEAMGGGKVSPSPSPSPETGPQGAPPPSPTPAVDETTAPAPSPTPSPTPIQPE
jgi:hypothetical protein